MNSKPSNVENEAVAGRPWAMRMVWRDLAFLHWAFDPQELRPLLPRGVELDTFEGRAWVGVVPFFMRGVRAHWTPPLPGLSAFPEINLRTYVTAGGRSGVWFFSLDVTSRPAVWVARTTFHLPYFRAAMRAESEGEGVRYEHRRDQPGAPEAAFAARYRPKGPVFESEPGTLEDFLTNRLCLFAARPDGRIVCGEVRHDPWPLQSAEVELERNDMFGQVGLDMPSGPPLAHFARELDVLAWTVRAL